MNPSIQVKKAAFGFLVPLVCFGLLPKAKAVSPPPPGAIPTSPLLRGMPTKSFHRMERQGRERHRPAVYLSERAGANESNVPQIGINRSRIQLSENYSELTSPTSLEP